MTFVRAIVAAVLFCSAAIAASQGSNPIVVIVDEDAPTALAREAFLAAFGTRDSASVTHEDHDYDFSPLGAIELGDGRIALLSTGALRDAGHPETGLNAVHYLSRDATGLRVVGQWFGLGAPGTMGNAAIIWGASRALSRWPMLYTEGAGIWQGCSSSWATLTELRPAGPVDVAEFQVSYSDVSTGWRKSVGEVDGVIDEAVPDTSFSIRYSGARSFRETYVRRGDVYQRQGGESRVPTC